MQEALMLWQSIVNSHWFRNSALILFLNKIDLFKQKIAYSPITKFGFSDFTGDVTSWQQTSTYFMKKFVALNCNPTREVHGPFTNATDTLLLRVAMVSIQDMITERNVRQLRIL
jgi:guanine nucleotide-binding protein subunit alpha